MLRKTLLVSLTLGFLGACAVSPEEYKVGTKNGEDYYALDVQGLGGPNATHLKHWSNQLCPQGYRVVSSKRDWLTPGMSPGMNWYDVTIACPAQ